MNEHPEKYPGQSGRDSRLRCGVADAFVDMIRKLREIVDELLHQRLRRAVIGLSLIHI